MTTTKHEVIAMGPIDFGRIQAYLRPFAIYYPGIELWFEKVWRESWTGRRRVWATTIGGELAGLAITKRGERAKLCHISVSAEMRGSGVGIELMRFAMEDLLMSGAQTVLVTASDEANGQYGEFFSRCGYELLTYLPNRYVRGTDEFVWVANRAALSGHLFPSAPGWPQHSWNATVTPEWCLVGGLPQVSLVAARHEPQTHTADRETPNHGRPVVPVVHLDRQLVFRGGHDSPQGRLVVPIR